MAKNFSLVFKHDDELPNHTTKINKEAVANGLYNTACNKLHEGIMASVIKCGYVRLYFGNTILREYHSQQIIAGETATV